MKICETIVMIIPRINVFLYLIKYLFKLLSSFIKISLTLIIQIGKTIYQQKKHKEMNISRFLDIFIQTKLIKYKNMTINSYSSEELKKIDPVFGQISFDHHEQVVFCHDKDTGLKAIIGIHNTVLGPALGGTRMWNYTSEWEALNDVLRLSRGMTYKSAISGLDLGGGKAVIIGDSKKDKNPEMIQAFARYVDSLSGRYITAEDVGTTTADMDLIHSITPHVTGISESLGGSGNPSPVTAYGVFMGLKAASKFKFGTDDL